MPDSCTPPATDGSSPPLVPTGAGVPSPDSLHQPTPSAADQSSITPTPPSHLSANASSAHVLDESHPHQQSAAATATTTAGGLTIPSVPGLEEKQHIESLLTAAESEFRFTIEVLRDDDVLTKFRVEHEKLFRSLTRSVLTGVRMFEQYSSLHRTFHENVNNAKTLGESTSQDEQTIRSLRGQIKRANEFLESSRVKEEKSKDELRQLRIEVNDLKATVSQGVGLSAVQERNINDLVKMKEEALKDLDLETEKIAHLRSRIVDITDRTRSMDAERRSLEAEVHTLKERCAARKIDIDAELRNRDNLETDLREMRQVVSVKIAEVKQKQDAVARALEDIALLQNQVKSQKQMLEKVGRDHESLSSKAAKYRAECDQQVAITNALTDANNASLRDLQKKEGELAKVTDVLGKASKVRDGLQKKIRMLETKKGEAETTMKLLKDDTNQVLATIDQLRQDVDKSKKTLEDLSRERNILSGNFSKLASDMERDQHALLLLQQTRTNLEQDRTQCERLLERKKRQLDELERDKAMYSEKSAELTEQATALQARIKQRESEVYAHKKAVVESDTRLKYQQNLYETVQSDRNLHAKNLVDSQNEISEMKRQLKIMTFTINGLKEEFTAKQESFAREVADRERLDKEMETIDNEINTLKHQSELAQAYIRTQIAEENKLAQDLKEAETEKQKQEHALAMVVSERDRLSAQLIKQDDELLKVYDAIKASQFALLRSQKHYVAKRRQKQALERRVREQVKERRLLELATRDYDFLKQAVCQLKAELLEEQAHIKVLADEIKNPVNIHRWRKLEGSDPGQLETIQLVHSLQRTLIARAAEDAAKEAEIHEREQTYLQLKEIHARQVGPEAHEQVAELEAVLADKVAKHKHMQTEVEMYRAQINEYKYKLSGLERQLAELKALYFERKRLEEAEAKKQPAATSPQRKGKIVGRSKRSGGTMLANPKHSLGDNEFNAVLDAWAGGTGETFPAETRLYATLGQSTTPPSGPRSAEARSVSPPITGTDRAASPPSASSRTISPSLSTFSADGTSAVDSQNIGGGRAASAGLSRQVVELPPLPEHSSVVSLNYSESADPGKQTSTQSMDQLMSSQPQVATSNSSSDHRSVAEGGGSFGV